MKVLIIEDEKAAVKRLISLLTAVEPSAEIMGSLESVEKSVMWLAGNPAPDLIFMDIHLADGSSFEIFEQTQVKSPVIFTTAYDEYAIRAFKVNSVDYLLKPVKKDELKASLEKFRMISKPAGAEIDLEALLNTLKKKSPDRPERFVINQGQKIVVVNIADSAYFFTKDKVTFLRTFQGRSYSLDYSLDKIDEMVDPSEFFRINRHLIVSMRAIDEMYSWTKSRVKIKLNPPCELEAIVSAERSPAFKEWLKKG